MPDVYQISPLAHGGPCCAMLHFPEERYRRRGYECGLDARDYQEVAEERFIEEDEDSVDSTSPLPA